MRFTGFAKRILTLVLAICILVTVPNFGLVGYADETNGVIMEPNGDENVTIPDEGWGDEEVKETIVSSSEQLETALAGDYNKIDIVSDFTVDRTFFITKDTVIYSNENITLTRDSAFGGDMFVVGSEGTGGEDVNSNDSIEVAFGSENAKISIDGNKDNVTADVVGTVFLINKQANVQLRGITVKNAKKTGNERILDEEKYSVTYKSQVGGAAVILDLGKLDIYDSEFTDNEVSILEEDTEDSLSGRGGAIYSFGELNVYNSRFVGNSATKGGAIYNYRETHLNNITLKGNTASTVGGAIYVPSSTVAFVYTDNAVFEENTATDGGAIYAYGTCDLKDSTFKSNTASSGYGGAVYVSNKKTDKKSLVTSNVTFEANISSKSGGAVFVDASAEVSFCSDTFTGNISQNNNGGAIYVKSAAPTVIDGATFTGNKSLASHGGAIAAAGIAEGTERTFELYNSSFTQNSAAKNGGALYFSSNAISELKNVKFIKNIALADNGTAYGGGAVYGTGSKIDVDGAEFTENASGFMGGAFEIHASSTAKVNNVTVTGNTAQNSSGGAFEIQSSSSIALNNVTATGNTAATGRGGFMSVKSAEAKLWNSKINNNTASIGGAIAYREGSSGGVYNTEFNENEASGNGGAMYIYTDKNTVTLHTVKFNGNVSGNFGGGVYAAELSQVNMYNITAKVNRAVSGGFLYETKTGTVINLNGLTVSGNQAENGPIIFGNTTGAKLNINKSNYVDEDAEGELDSSYWASAIVNKLTVVNVISMIPGYRDFGEEGEDTEGDVGDVIVGVTSSEELKRAIDLGYGKIQLLKGFDIDRTFELKHSISVFAVEDVTLTRDPSFGGDMFLLGSDTDTEDDNTEQVVITFGSENTKITIDGNKSNMNTEVKGTVFFARNSVKAELRGINVVNAKKTANERTLEEAYGLSYPERIGGPAVILESGELDIYNSTFENNEVNDEGTDNPDMISTQGGAIYSFGKLNVYNSSFKGNHAARAGAIYNYRKTNVKDTTFTDNTASNMGGVVYVPSSISAFFYTDNVTFNNNSAKSGGVVYSLGTVGFKNTKFTDNQSTGGNGGAVYVVGKKTAQRTLEAENVVFRNNTSSSAGGAVYISTATVDEAKVGAETFFNGAVFDSNKALNGHGGAVWAAGGDENDIKTVEFYNATFNENCSSNSGGAIYFGSKAASYMEDVIFSKNKSLAAGGTAYGGGAIYGTGAVIEINGAKFIENSSDYFAGAVEAHSSSVLTLNDITAERNTAGYCGGFMYIKGASFTMYNSYIKGNIANDSAGGMYIREGASGAIYKTDFIENKSLGQKGNGGALFLYTDGGKVIANDVLFNGNSATNFGGAIQISGKSLLDLYNAEATYNTSAFGGFMYETVTGTVVNINGLTIKGNNATNGPVIYGNTTGAVLNLNKSNYIDKDLNGEPGDSYWATAIANKLTVKDLSGEIPKAEDYGNETTDMMDGYTDVRTIDDLEAALLSDAKNIRVTSNIVLDRTLYVTGEKVLFSTTKKTITRSPGFIGDMFVVGEDKNGNYPLISGIETVFTLGNPESKTENLLIIDGNRGNIKENVCGSAIFVAGSAVLKIYDNTSIINHYKNGNERGFAAKYDLGSPEKIGGAAIVNIDGTVYMYGGLIENNMSDGTETGINGGAIHNRANFTVYNGTFRNNEGTLGGVVYNLKRFDVIEGKFIDNHSLRNGGAIYVASSQYAHLYVGKTENAEKSDKILFKNNTADSSGAAIYNSIMGAVIINGDVTFDSNTANVSGGALATYGTLTVSNATFVNNSAKNRGGAIYLSNSNDDYTTRIVSLNNSIFTGNKSTAGGAIAVYASNTELSEGGIVEIDKCDFIENNAVNLTDKPDSTSVYGGAVFNSRKGSVTISNSKFNGNTAQYEGGVLYSAGESKTTITGSSFTNNLITDEKGRGGVLSVHSATVDFEDSQFTGNYAPSNGGALYISYTTASAVNSSVTVKGSVFSDNTTDNNGGAIYATKHETEKDKRVLTVKDTEFNNNTAKANGGAVYLTAKVEASMKEVDFNGNKVISENDKIYGGAIYMASGVELKIDGATFKDNESSYCAGGIALNSSSEIMLNNVTAEGNKAGGSAGFIYGNNSKIVMFDSVIKNNSVGGNGGAMAVYNNSTSAAYGVTFEGNMAGGAGGAVYAYQNLTEMLLHSCTFKENEAKSNGGAIYLSNEGILNMYHTEASGNRADKGGFFYETTTGTEATIRNLIVDGNSATTDGDIIFGNSFGATLYIDKVNYEDRVSDNEANELYWDYAVKNMLTVVNISGTDKEIPERLYFETEEDAEEEETERKLDPVSNVLALGISSSDDAINSTYGSFERLDNSSNFMSDNVTVFNDINGEDVTVDTFVYHPKKAEGNGNFGLGMLIYQTILYKAAHPEEDVKVSIAEFRFEMETAICINRNSRYFGYMRNLVSSDYDKYGFVRISYLLVTAAKMGIDVTVMGQIPGYPHNSINPDFTGYFEEYLKDPCDPVYVGEGKKVSDYMNFVHCKWTSYEDKAGSDMMHVKMVTASHYLDMNGVERKNAVFSSSSNLDGIYSNGTNGNDNIQTATIVTNHDALYRVATNYINLVAENCGQEDVYIFRSILAERTEKQFELILAGKENEIPLNEQIVYLGTGNDDVFELYFTPFGGEPNSWTEKYNPYCKYIRKLANSEDYIILTWNNANYISTNLVKTLEDMIIDAYHENKNPNNKIYINLAEFDSSAFSDLVPGTDIGLMKFNKKEFGGIHNKDLQVSYTENGQRSYVTLFNSLNMHSGAIGYQSNFVLVIKEKTGQEGSVFFALADNTTTGIVEHTYGEEKTYIPETDEDGYIYRECELCDKKVIIDLVHRPGSWNVAKEATSDENGIAYRSCVHCGKILYTKETDYSGTAISTVNYIKKDAGLKVSSDADVYSIDATFKSKPKTFEANFTLPKTVSDRGGILVGNYDYNSGAKINVEIYTNGKPRLYFENNLISYSYVFATDVRSDSNCHLAITVDGLKATLYINGFEKETVTIGAELANALSGYKIGSDRRPTGQVYFNGVIHSVALFDDVRTAQEIALDAIMVPGDTDGLIFSKYFLDTNIGEDKISSENVSYDGTTWSCDLSLFAVGDMSGNVYAVTYDNQTMKNVKKYPAADKIPVSIECSADEHIKIFWWDYNLKPICRELEIEVK